MTSSNRNLLAALGRALEYPRSGLDAQMIEIKSMARENQALCDKLDAFSQACSKHSQDSLAEVYTRTFDVAPRCIPYLSIHIFGEEAFHRARLMVGLRTSLVGLGIDPAPELPDHFAVILKAAPIFHEDEWEDLLDYVVRAGIHAMIESIDNAANQDNPYLPLLAAVQILVGEATETDLSRLQLARRSGQNCTPPGSQQSCTGGR